MMLCEAVVRAIQADAIERYPQEACGFVVDGAYFPYPNQHETPDLAFRISPQAWAAASKRGGIEVVVHSHVNGNAAPSAADMAGQIDSGVPWAIVLTDGEVAGDPWAWGDALEPPPLRERPFRHGPSGTDGKGDCYALIRDYYRLVCDATLMDFPRDDDWWTKGQDLYRVGFEKAGFRRIGAEQVEPGDVFLATLPAGGGTPGIPHHGGIVLESDLILHHLPGRLSRREPLGRWSKFMTHFLRYQFEGR